MILLLNQDGNHNGAQIDVLLKFSDKKFKRIEVIRRLEDKEKFDKYKNTHNIKCFPALLVNDEIYESISVREFSNLCIDNIS